MSAEQRDCLQCGTPFTWTTAAPKQKFCSNQCKHRWHGARRGPRRKRRRDRARDTAAQARPTTEVAATTGAGTTTQVGPHPPPPAGKAGEPGLTAVPACPHCRRPVALVAWLVPPAAATVREPPRHAGDTPQPVRDNP